MHKIPARARPEQAGTGPTRGPARRFLRQLLGQVAHIGASDAGCAGGFFSVDICYAEA